MCSMHRFYEVRFQMFASRTGGQKHSYWLTNKQFNLICHCANIFLFSALVLKWFAYQVGYWCVWRLGPGSQTCQWAGPVGRGRGIHHKWGCCDRSAPGPGKTHRDWLWNASAEDLECLVGSSLNPDRTKETTKMNKTTNVRERRCLMNYALSSLLIRDRSWWFVLLMTNTSVENQCD